MSKERDKTARYHRNRARVVDVAVELFSKHGYASTGVQDIGDAAGLARGALYYYIGSKEALLAEIHNRVLEPLLSESSAILALDLDFEAKLRLVSESLLWQIVNNPDNVWVFLHEYRQLQGEYRDQSREKRAKLDDCVRSILTMGAGEGRLRVDDIDLAVLAFFNLHNYTYQWVASRPSTNSEELAEFYCSIFLKGVLVPGDEASTNPKNLETGRRILSALRQGAQGAAQQ